MSILSRPMDLRQASVQEKLCLAFNVLCITAILGLLMWAFQRGFDFTDEASTILSAEQPYAEMLRTSEYALYTHYLYIWAGENLFLFRLYGLIIMLAASGYFAFQLTVCMAEHAPSSKLTTLSVGLAIWISIVGYYCKWYPSPNYYTVCLVGMVLAAGTTIQILRMQRVDRFRPFLFIALGLGLTLAALGRAPSAALMALPVTAVILWAYRRQFWMGFGGLVITGVTGMSCLLAHMMFVGEGIEQVVQIYLTNLLTPGRLEDAGYDASSLFGGIGHGFAMLGAAIMKRSWLLGIVGIFAVLARHSTFRPHFPYRTMSASILILLLITQSRWLLKNYGDPSEVVATMFMVVLATLVFAFLLVPPYVHVRPKGVWIASGILLAFLSWALAFGSNVPILWQSSRATIFLVAGILCVGWGMGSTALRQGLSALLCAATLGIVLAATFSAYRQGSLWEHTIPVALRGPGTEISVWPEAADYIQTLRSTAHNAGWKAGTPVVDLSGGNAGIAYILNAKISGFSRICGGYGLSSDIGAQQIIDSFSPEEKATLWLVTSDSPARISDEVLLRNFPNFPQGYEKVIELPSMGERHRVPLPTEYVWRPIVE